MAITRGHNALGLYLENTMAEPTQPVKLSPKEMAKIEADLREKIRKEEEVRKRNPAAVEPGPRYKTMERCYLNDRQYEPQDEFTWHGHPGHFMIPLNDEAREKMMQTGVMDAEGKIKHPNDPVAEGAKITP